MSRKKINHEKTCDECGRDFTATDSRRKLCNWCRRADPHRHRARRNSAEPIIVSIDGEGRADTFGIMHMITLSYGREDGSSRTHFVGERGVKGALEWLLDEVSSHYLTRRQVPVAFHFNWDSSVMAKDFDPKDMYLIRKVQKRLETTLCGTTHPIGEECRKRVHHADLDEEEAGRLGIELSDTHEGLLHRYDEGDIEAVITEGGESDLAAYDRESHLAIAISPKRRFYLEHRPNGDRFEEWRRVDIHDTGTAFTGSLLKVISDWNPELTPAQQAIIEWGKAARKETFHDAPIEKIAEYSEAECVAHARVCRKLLNLLQEAAHVPMKPDQLYGSGSVAGATLKFYGVPTRDQSDVENEEIARLTYFGGMIETPVVGLIPGLTDEVDINSAYPDKMVYIPCMRIGHGKHKHKRQRVHKWASGLRHEIGHVLVTWDVRGDDTSTPPFIVRDMFGRVFQPLIGTRTWVTLAEYNAAVERFGSMIIAHEIKYWEVGCDCDPPFAFLEELYDKRQEIKAEMKTVTKCSHEWWTLKSREQTIKLIINSIYGKLAQQRPRMGKYTNLHLASFITGATRAQVRRETWAREAQGGTVVYQHTDSVLSIGGSPTDGGPGLGAWGMEKPTKDLLILQPGLATSTLMEWTVDTEHEDGGYWAPQGKTASRGCRTDVFIDAAVKYANTTDLTQHPITWPSLTVTQTVMVSRRQALAWNKPHLAGSFQEKITEIHAAPRKRNTLGAVPLPGMPTAWQVPPITFVDNPATLESIKEYQSGLEKRRKSGEFD